MEIEIPQHHFFDLGAQHLAGLPDKLQILKALRCHQQIDQPILRPGEHHTGADPVQGILDHGAGGAALSLLIPEGNGPLWSIAPQDHQLDILPQVRQRKAGKEPVHILHIPVHTGDKIIQKPLCQLAGILPRHSSGFPGGRILFQQGSQLPLGQRVLQQIIVRAVFQTGPDIGKIVVSAEGYAPDAAALLRDIADQLHAVQDRHIHVRKHQSDVIMLVQQLNGRLAIVRLDQGKSVILPGSHAGKHGAKENIVIHKKCFFHLLSSCAFLRGSRMSTVVPRFSWLSMVME